MKRKGKTVEAIRVEPANPIQAAFIACAARESVFDGGVGSGKTVGGIYKLLLLADAFPNSRWFVGRQVYKDLIATTKKTFDRIVPRGWVKKDALNITTLHNNTEISWNHLDDYDLKSLMGLEINGAFLDQIEEISPDQIEILDSRIGRWSNPEWETHCPAYLWSTANPAGKDHVYWRYHPDVVQNPDRAYFFAQTSDNRKCLDKHVPGYYDNLLKKSPEWRKRWVEGSRDIFEGKIFTEFLPDGPHIYDHKKFNPYEAFGQGAAWGWMDYGLTSPTTLLVSWSTQAKFHFITSEYGDRSTQSKVVTIRDHAARIRQMTLGNPSRVKGVFADPSIFHESTRDRRVITNSVAKEFAGEGLYLLKADNNEETSLAVLHEMLFVDPNRKNPITGKMGSPLLFISDACPQLIKELDMQRHEEIRNPLTGEREWQSTRNETVSDHYFDPLRYFANSKVHQVSGKRPQPAIPSYKTA